MYCGPDQFEIDLEVLVGNHVPKVFHPPPRDLGVLRCECIRYSRRGLSYNLQRVKYRPLQHFISDELVVGHIFKVPIREVDCIKDVFGV